MEGLQPCVGLQIVNTLCPGWEVAWESQEAGCPQTPPISPGQPLIGQRCPVLPLQPLSVPRVQQDLNGAWTSEHVQTRNIWDLTWDP